MLIGKLVRLREYREEDLKLAQEYLNDFEIKKYLFPMTPFPLTLNDEKKWYEKVSFLNENYEFAIEALDKGIYLGGCGLKNLDWKNSHTEVGIFIGLQEYLGKGYGTEAMNLMINFIFMEMGLNKIKLDVYDFNQRAAACYEKCGFKKEAVLKNEIYRNGRFSDIIRMSIFKEDFLKRIN